MREDPKIDVLRQVGEALHGERWQVPLATDLGVSDRTVRYWLSGGSSCPGDIGTRLLTVVSRRKQELGLLESVLLEKISRIGGNSSEAGG